jgi:hypothetical protein
MPLESMMMRLDKKSTPLMAKLIAGQFKVKFESFGKPGILEVENHGCYWKGFEYKTGLEFKKGDFKAPSNINLFKNQFLGFER